VTPARDARAGDACTDDRHTWRWAAPLIDVQSIHVYRSTRSLDDQEEEEERLYVRTCMVWWWDHMQDATNKAAHYWRIDEKGQVMKHKVRIRTCLVNEVVHACMHALIPMYVTWSLCQQARLARFDGPYGCALT
jgi:hypothetical protein